MTGYLSDTGGTVWRLPTLLSWDVTHGLGEPSDCFEVSFLYAPDMADALYKACRFRAEYNGKTVFTGVVDEYELTADENGMTVSINGHVTPWGITDIRKKAMDAAPVFRVTSGDSQWKILREFCRFCGNTLPRFTRDGVLLLDGSQGDAYKVDLSTAVTAQTFRDTRSGVISEVLVKNRGASAVVENQVFKARGGCARRGMRHRVGERLHFVKHLLRRLD